MLTTIISRPGHSNPQAALIKTVFATLGTPAEFRANSIHEPGTAIPASFGTVRLYVFVPVDSGTSGIRLWSVLTVWVAEPYRMREKLFTAESVVTVIFEPTVIVVADIVLILGRVASVPSDLNK